MVRKIVRATKGGEKKKKAWLTSQGSNIVNTI